MFQNVVSMIRTFSILAQYTAEMMVSKSGFNSLKTLEERRNSVTYDGFFCSFLGSMLYISFFITLFPFEIFFHVSVLFSFDIKLQNHRKGQQNEFYIF